jgi:histidine triad (HIT) family protein
MYDCPFCRVVASDPDTLTENEMVMAIRDRNPQAPVHALLISKRHHDNMVECDDPAVLLSLMLVAREVADELRLKDGFRLVVNTGAKHAGQQVEHLHAHLLAGRPLGDIATPEPK